MVWLDSAMLRIERQLSKLEKSCSPSSRRRRRLVLGVKADSDTKMRAETEPQPLRNEDFSSVVVANASMIDQKLMLLGAVARSRDSTPHANVDARRRRQRQTQPRQQSASTLNDFQPLQQSESAADQLRKCSNCSARENKTSTRVEITRKLSANVMNALNKRVPFSAESLSSKTSSRSCFTLNNNSNNDDEQQLQLTETRKCVCVDNEEELGCVVCELCAKRFPLVCFPTNDPKTEFTNSKSNPPSGFENDAVEEKMEVETGEKKGKAPLPTAFSAISTPRAQKSMGCGYCNLKLINNNECEHPSVCQTMSIVSEDMNLLVRNITKEAKALVQAEM